MSECYLNISAGGGPTECEWVVVQLAHAFVREGGAAKLVVQIIWDEERLRTAPSLLVKVSSDPGQASLQEAFCEARIGTVRWIGQSPFRKNHKRKNWYVGVTRAPDPIDVPTLNERDIRYQTMAASGPGGQHVNTTNSAVRATHIPTGISVTAREERSQHANKRLTRIKLAMIFQVQGAVARRAGKRQVWESKKDLERGNETRIYQGARFNLKCPRTK